jgi:V/A-type H+-transporting ATPase subunit I
MIVPMKKYRFLVHHSEYVDFLNELRALGLVHIQYQDYEPKEEYMEELEQKKAIQNTLKRLGHRAIDPAPATEAESPQEGREIVFVVRELEAELEQIQQKQGALKKEIDFYRPWGDFSISMIQNLAEEGLSVRFFACPLRKYQTTWETTYQMEVISQSPPDIHFVVFSEPGADLELDAEEIPPPQRSLSEMERLRDGLTEEIERIRERLDEFAANGIHALEAALHESEKNLQLIQVVQSTQREVDEHIMLMEGFAPARQHTELAQWSEAQGAILLDKTPTPADNPPILLKNNRFSRLFEPIGKLFALPKYQELDLTPFFAPFFMLFFGFCLGDAGYGLFLLFGATIVKWRAKKEQRPILSLVQWLGVATILFGAITGTFFGINLLETRVAWLDQVRQWMLDSDQAFRLALVLGMVQILFGLIIKGINQFRQFGWVYSLSTLGWILLLLALLDQALLKLTGSVAQIGIYIGLGLILLFNDPKAGILSRLGKGIWELYGITGIFGDLLSYIRLFALGISSAILGYVINDIALQIMGSGKIIGPILFVIFLLIGHGLNLLIASLGAFVHPMRLTFVEFYKNAGFTGGGKAYEPFSANNKKTTSSP